MTVSKFKNKNNFQIYKIVILMLFTKLDVILTHKIHFLI